MDRVGVAVIGAGSIAGYHLAGLAAAEGAILRAVVGRDRAKAAAVAARHAVPDASDDLRATLARDDVDAVVIATPDDTHEAIATQAARAGKAILLQKPAAPDSAACRRILAASRAAGVDLQVSFMHRHFEEVVRARALIADGAIGRVLSLRMRNATPGPDWADWFFRKDAVSGGVVLQLGVHGIDLVEHLFGPIAAVCARIATLLAERRLADGRAVRVENPDSAWATYELECGAMASHEMSMVEAIGCDRFRLEVYGSEGTLWLRGERGALALGTRRDGWSVPALPDAPLGRRHHQRWLDGLRGRAASEATAEAALHGLLVAEAIARSAASGGRREPVAAG